MEAFFLEIKDYFLDYVSQFSFFLDGNYYENLFDQYFSVGGFIIGFIFVLLIYFSSAEDQDKAGFFKVLAAIAVINCCTVLAQFINSSFHQGIPYYGVAAMINAPDNIISGFIFTLVVFSCYEDYGGFAFVFGLATNAALPLLNFSALEYLPDALPIYQMVLRLLLVGFLSLIISHRDKFYTAWIWYFGFHVFMRIAVYFLPLLANAIEETDVYHVDLSLQAITEYLSRFTVDGIIFAVVLVFALVFEKGVLSVKTRQGTA